MRYSLSGLLIVVTLCAVALGVRQSYIRSHVDTELDNLQNHPNAIRRYTAAIALGEMGPSARAAVPTLIEILLHEQLGDFPGNSRGRQLAHALSNIGAPAIPDLCKALADSTQRARGWGMFPPAAKSLGKPLIFVVAQDFVSRRGPDRAPVVAVLQALRSDPCGHVRAWASEALGQTSRPSSKSRVADVDIDATIAENKRPNFEEMIDEWTTRLNSKDAIERAWAVHMLGELVRDRRIHAVSFEAQIAALGRALADSDPHVGYQAAYAFRQVGRSGYPGARQVVPTIVEALMRPNDHPGWNDRDELANKQSEVELPIGIGDNARSGVPTKVVLWPSDWNILFRVNLVYALGEIGPAAEAAVPTLIELLQNFQEDPAVRGAAAESLGLIGPKASSAAEALLKALDYHSPTGIRRTAMGRYYPTLREAVISALNQIDPDAAAKAGVKLDTRAP